MKVYAVLQDMGYQGELLTEIFSTRELADSYVASLDAGYVVAEYVVDAEAPPRRATTDGAALPPIPTDLEIDNERLDVDRQPMEKPSRPQYLADGTDEEG